MNRLFLRYIWMKEHAFLGTKYPNDRVRHLNSISAFHRPRDGIVVVVVKCDANEKNGKKKKKTKRKVTKLSIEFIFWCIKNSFALSVHRNWHCGDNECHCMHVVCRLENRSPWAKKLEYFQYNFCTVSCDVVFTCLRNFMTNKTIFCLWKMFRNHRRYGFFVNWTLLIPTEARRIQQQ